MSVASSSSSVMINNASTATTTQEPNNLRETTKRKADGTSGKNIKRSKKAVVPVGSSSSSEKPTESVRSVSPNVRRLRSHSKKAVAAQSTSSEATSGKVTLAPTKTKKAAATVPHAPTKTKKAAGTLPSTQVTVGFGPTVKVVPLNKIAAAVRTVATPFTSSTLPSTQASIINGTNQCARPTPTAKIPTPPNWHDHFQDAATSLDRFRKYSVDKETAEHRVIADLLQPIQITQIDQIVNPELWKRFVHTRTEMFRSNTDDLNLLSKLGFDEQEILRCANLSINFNKNPLVVPYSDNMMLLFHCTRSEAMLEDILSQGLDERLSHISSGLLGKGIYFADDPRKCIQYDRTGKILIFAVLLGDCTSVDHFPNQNTLVREPEKVKQQKRNCNDLFFDSIAARPAAYNEYVIYNRYQCYPIYQVKYDRTALPSNISNSNIVLPPIVWFPQKQQWAMPIQDETISCSFFAVDIFAKMGVARPTDDESINTNVNDSPPPTSVDENLAQLYSFGFVDVEENKKLLSKFNNDINKTINYLLDKQLDVIDLSENIGSGSTSTSIPMTSGTPKKKSHQTINFVDLIDDSDDNYDDDDEISNDVTVTVKSESTPPAATEDCPICCDELESFHTSPTLWNELTCSHKLCRDCYSKILTSRVTMSGTQHTFVKCPFCQGVSGIEVGTCPDMEMNVTIQKNSCESYQPSSTIVINYVNTSHTFCRIAYLPNNAEGQEVLRLLEIAFDRRLCFTVGTSVTTGQENTIVWNIHHKTSMTGGVAQYGYPDASYMDRVKRELKAVGIE